jgi:hypothetical protein
MAKKLEGVAKRNVDAAVRQRHTQPQLAVRNLMEALAHVPERAVKDHISKVDKAAVDELWALLATRHLQDRAS